MAAIKLPGKLARYQGNLQGTREISMVPGKLARYQENYHGTRKLPWYQEITMVPGNYHGTRKLPWYQEITMEPGKLARYKGN